MIGQRRDVEVDALAGIALALPVQGLVLAVLGIEDHRQQARPDVTPRDDMERRRRLGDLLARPAGELLTNGLDHFPLARHHLQRLGDGLAELGEPAATTWARRRTGDHHALARQMRRKGRAHRLLAGERPHRRVLAWRGGSFILGRACRRFLELQLQLVEQFAAALGGLAVLLAPELGDQQLVMGDQGLGARGARLGLLSGRPLGDERGLERADVVGDRLGHRHEPDCLTSPTP